MRAMKRKEKAGVASKDNPDGLTPLQVRRGPGRLS